MSENSKPPFNVDLSAKAEVKLEGKIPEKQVGSFVEAVTDLIRPISELCGLTGDYIKLRREDVAIKILRKAQERIALEQLSPQPVPLKLLLPVVELGSREEPDDETMIELWSRLLTSAATGNDVSPRFVSILSELTAMEAKFLAYVGQQRLATPPTYLIHKLDVEARSIVQDRRDHEFTSTASQLEEFLAAMGSGLVDCSLTISSQTDVRTMRGAKSDAANILQSLGLIEIYAVMPNYRDNGSSFTWQIRYCELSQFGLLFLNCVMPHDSKEKAFG